MDQIVRRAAALAASAAFAILAGCSSTPELDVPQLAIVSIATTSADMFNQQFVVRVNVENPNEIELPVKAIEYRLFLEGDSFAEGVWKHPFKVPAKGEKDVDVMVTTNFVSGLGRLLSRLNGRDQVNYVFEGTMMTEVGAARKIPFQETGSVQLSGMVRKQ
jgi:LEA14-like dessication related protein